MRSKLQLSPKKRPSTPRGEETYRHVVAATARLLERGGYEALTTNHVAKRAGVGIASVYEFFPSKHALVAAVIEQTVEGVLAELAQALEQAMQHGTDPLAEWIGGMFSAVEKRKRLLSVLVQEVPFFRQVPAVVAAGENIQDLARRARALQGEDASPYLEAMTYLMPIMVAHAVIDSVIRPPEALAARSLEHALVMAVRRILA